jgi:hypothetical protein
MGIQASDPQALSLAAQSIAAMTGGVALSDATLAGSVTRVAGPDTDVGRATLMAKGSGESRIDLTLRQGNRSEIRNNSSGVPEGEWIGPDGIPHMESLHNCWTDASWFFPVFSSLAASDPSLVLSYVGLETRSGSSVHHIRSYRYLANAKSDVTSLTQQLSTVDYYLDATTLLPVAAKFNTHADDDAGINLPVEIDFLQYQTVGGVQVPSHVQKFFRGSLILNFLLSNFAANSGLSDSLFAIQ